MNLTNEILVELSTKLLNSENVLKGNDRTSYVTKQIQNAKNIRIDCSIFKFGK